MNAMAKWIGGATLAVALALVLLFRSGSAGTEAANAASGPAAAPFGVEGAIGARFASLATRPDPDFTINSILPIEGPMKYGEWHWDASRAPADGTLVITVDLDARVISAFRGGHEIGAAVAMLGTDEHPTPLGSFPILTKERHNVSEKYGNAPMPWTLRLTWDGIAIHGGSEVENGYASHGCIAVPDDFADRLFDVAHKGDVVIITDGKRLDIGDAIAR
ncbi:L,D-transpeptidase family protein [Qipengyuania spongiae]|uniref:L,D-transpeptidase family protein n=1 Tax=Qipengyuania spongiae TaxID=2909673 RepID=A0ABY5T1N5_9SPHN|nr:L,D-transpeptidase family protein [Qipengyuania spongiae]UVI40325.1 L,D-transpeptidase family protein [Qipengyuania spongiae]